VEIQAVSSSKTVPVMQIVRAQYASGKIALPVKRNQYIYSNFEHVYGTPSVQSDRGYSLSKLRALDNLIKMLDRVGPKHEGLMPFPDEKPPNGESGQRIDTLINTYAGSLHQALTRQNLVGYNSTGLESGLLFNLTA